MSAFRTVTSDFAVSPQIAIADLATAKAEGFVLVISNRPDGEEPDQPNAAEMEARARALGLGFLSLPIRGMATPEQAADLREARLSAGGKVLAFCRSGTRSVTAWALGERLAGAMEREAVIEAGRRAGYDLSGLPV